MKLLLPREDLILKQDLPGGCDAWFQVRGKGRTLHLIHALFLGRNPSFILPRESRDDLCLSLTEDVNYFLVCNTSFLWLPETAPDGINVTNSLLVHPDTFIYQKLLPVVQGVSELFERAKVEVSIHVNCKGFRISIDCHNGQHLYEMLDPVVDLIEKLTKVKISIYSDSPLRTVFFDFPPQFDVQVLQELLRFPFLEGGERCRKLQEYQSLQKVLSLA